MTQECNVGLTEFLTRSDIARILKISTKQAGRLMQMMPSISVGQKHRRVARADFIAWSETERERSANALTASQPPIAAKRRIRPSKLGAPSEKDGAITRAVREMNERRRREAGVRKG